MNGLPRGAALGATALLALTLALAGCVAPPSAEVEPQSALGMVDALAALEAGAPSANLELLGEWRNSGTAEIAAHGDLLYVMRSGAVEILNVSDPANIVEVATIKGPHRVLDVKLSDDGKYLFVGDDAQGSMGVEGEGRFTGGFYAYDVSDPEDAKLVAYVPIGPRRGPHMVAYHRLPDGREILFGASADISIVEFDRDAGTLTELARYSPDLVFGFNRSPYVVDVLYQGWAHDMFVMTEPDGRVLMYVANWDAGLRIVDVTDPAKPTEIGGWNEFPEGHSGNLHTVSAAWIDGKKIVVGTAEVGFAVVGGIGYAQGAEPGALYVWDATDPAAPMLIGQWENPEEIKAGGRSQLGEGVYSSHNFQLEDGRIWLAHYGLGVFVLDVSTPERWAEPTMIAYYREEGASTWDVILHDGVMWTSGAEGVLALGSPILPAGLTSRA